MTTPIKGKISMTYELLGQRFMVTDESGQQLSDDDIIDAYNALLSENAELRRLGDGMADAWEGEQSDDADGKYPPDYATRNWRNYTKEKV
jgi:ornithine cyclodeaminase/alanine dehydrogenase-like protein (mu-crystallin family)